MSKVKTQHKETRADEEVRPKGGAIVGSIGRGAMDHHEFSFTAEQRKIIRDSFLGGATESEAAMLLEVARIRRLNPITRQIHFVARETWNPRLGRKEKVWAFQVSIDGFRAIADRTGKYDGQDEPEFEYEADGKTIKLCRVRIWRKDWTRPAIGLAHFSEYAQYTGGKDGKEKKLNTMWEGKPHIMIAKCAEAAAHRKAFPEDTSGLYVEEEFRDEEIEVGSGSTADDVSSKPTGKGTESLKQKVAAKAAEGRAATALPAKAETKQEAPAPNGMDAATHVVFGPMKGRAIAELDSATVHSIIEDGKDKLFGNDKEPWAAKLQQNIDALQARFVELESEELERQEAKSSKGEEEEGEADEE